jgi:hypothetical protein
MRALLSRRHLLRSATSAAGGFGGILLLGAGAAGAAAVNVASASQLQKQDVRYQDQPKGGQRCGGCNNFVTPSACRVVSGSVNPNGWCLLFQAKTT